MQDALSMISSLKRPRLLVRAARFGVDDYSRTHCLPRIFGDPCLTRPGEAVVRLLEVEIEMDTLRQRKAADYSIAAHVEVLIALMGEARLIRRAYATDID